MIRKQSPVASQKNSRHRFAQSVCRCQNFIHNGQISQFGNKHNHFGLRIRFQPFHSLQHGNTADLGIQIAAPGADDGGNSITTFFDDTGDFLCTAAGSPNNTDRTAGDNAPRCQRHTADQSDTAIRPHNQTAFFNTQPFESQFVFQRYIVAENKHIQPFLQSFFRFCHRILSRQRNLHQIKRVLLQIDFLQRVVGYPGVRIRFMVKDIPNQLKRLVHFHFRICAHGNYQIIGSHIFWELEPEPLQHFPVYRCAHLNLRRMDSAQLLHPISD